MARFKYVGDPKFSDADELAYFGTVFYRGEVSKVTEPLYVAKMETMAAFERVEDDAPLNERAYEAEHGRKKPGRKPKIDLSGEPKDEDDDDAADVAGTDHPSPPTFKSGGGWSRPVR